MYQIRGELRACWRTVPPRVDASVPRRRARVSNRTRGWSGIQWLLGPALAIVVGSVFVGSSALGLPAPDEKWIQIRTPHFLLCSNAKPKLAREFAWQLDRFWALLEGGVQDFRSTTVIVFRDESSFAPYKTKPSGTTQELAGVFLATREGDLIGMNGDPSRHPLRIVFHEYIHSFLSRNFWKVPVWYNEGLAEYYSTFSAHGDRVEIGLPVEEHVRDLRARKLLPLEALFRIDQSSQDYNEGQRRGVFYAQSWALTHYWLLGKPGLTERVLPFLESWNDTVNANWVCETAFGLDCQDLDDELREYIQFGDYPYRKSRVPSDRTKDDFKTEPMSRSDALCTLGDYLLQMTPWREDDAEAHFRAVLAADSSHARAHSGLARVLERKNRPSEAERHDQAAIDLDREDDLLFFRYALSKIEAQTKRRGIPVAPRRLPRSIEKARTLLVRTLELNPNRAEAYVLMGNTYLFDPDGALVGIGYLEQAHSMLRTRMDVLVSLLYLRLRVGDLEEAQHLARILTERSKDPKIVALIDRAFDAYKRRLQIPASPISK